MGKKYDLVVKVGEFTNSQGETKARYENIGVVMESDKGLYMMLKRTFNPAGVPVDAGRDSILVSMFTPKGEQERQAPQTTQNHTQPDLDDEIPF